jgi:hypothetical protein
MNSYLVKMITHDPSVDYIAKGNIIAIKKRFEQVPLDD